jgi:hypothetical protein
MSQKPLIILGGPEYPYFSDCFNYQTKRPTIDCPMPGLTVEVSSVYFQAILFKILNFQIIQLIAMRLNITTKYINVYKYPEFNAAHLVDGVGN